MDNIAFGKNQLTEEIKIQLKEGTKIEFKWYGNKEILYTGRIEVNEFGELFFVNEHCYTNFPQSLQSMRFYTRLESFYHFTYFKILKND
jgi:hypothetical protein